MFSKKLIISLVMFSFFMVFTSIIKTKTRLIEKNINLNERQISILESEIYESQLDFFYLTSPFMIEKKINHLDNHNYIVMEYSKIFLSMTDFMNLDTKYAIQEIENEKKTKKK